MARLVMVDGTIRTDMRMPSWITIQGDTIGIHPERVSWLWHVMLPWMMGNGVQEDAARKLLGKAQKIIPREELIWWCEGVVKADPRDPVAYMEAALKSLKQPEPVVREDPQATLEVDLSHEAWMRDMRARTGDPDWMPGE